MVSSDFSSSFSGIDFVLFSLVLVISFLIGLYHGVWSKNKQHTPEEYFLGSRNMGVLPVTMSLIVTFVSGVNIIGLSVETYVYGTYLWHYVFTIFIMLLFTTFIFLPIFHELQLPSSFAYLKLRFGRSVQLLASFIYLMTTTLYVSINLYVPALVLVHVLGIPIPVTVVVLGSVCIFYTAIGGFSAVIWADLFQTILLVVCCVAISYIGLDLVGGVDDVWKASERGALIMYAFYESCDPVASGVISKRDQLFSLFVFEMAEHFPGLPGLFIAGVFAGTLSTMSSCLNSSTVCFYEDFVQPHLPEMSQRKTCNILKLITLCIGIIEISLVFILEKIGTVYTILITITGFTSGSMLGLFTLGMFIPRANQKGAIAGTLSSLVVVGIIIFGSFSKKPDPILPMRTDGCLHNVTISSPKDDFPEEDLPWIFRISFMYFATIGFFIVYIVGIPVSLLTKHREVKDQRLFAPFMRKSNDIKHLANDEEMKPLSG
ncbi:sodium-coupled monocarboxylate transporter 2-like [Phlebotomus argentipes]|uniref:sodium-coupled monocarboxylate transporter 2-like n=1 Tax=Phlebotomus argentipes TaxID=94469 RepID=UPI0028936860|nr:sodium-coupled monocarboxylate transporter 2-like [Phlebotomus argentipes]